MENRVSRIPPLNSLRAFEAAARHLNFRLAAEELNVTQAAVAQHVRGLEAYLGIKLFQRLPRSLKLTEQGRQYVPDIRQAFELMADATRALRPGPERLTISVTPTIASKWLIPRLPAFVEAHPFVDLRIVATEKLSDFRNDDVDVAVRRGNPPFGTELISDLLFTQQVIAVCSPALLAPGAAALGPHQLADQVLLQDFEDLWPQFLKQVHGVSVPAGARKLRFNQTSLAIDAAIAGQGIALVSRFLVESELNSSRLLQALPGVLRGAADFYVVVPRNPRSPQAAGKLRSWLLAQSTHHPSPGISAPYSRPGHGVNPPGPGQSA